MIAPPRLAVALVDPDMPPRVPVLAATLLLPTATPATAPVDPDDVIPTETLEPEPAADAAAPPIAAIANVAAAIFVRCMMTFLFLYLIVLRP
jgi:hypothetical protein